jgi:hypothetical protein
MINNYFKMSGEDQGSKAGLDGLERFMDSSSSSEEEDNVEEKQIEEEVA